MERGDGEYYSGRPKNLESSGSEDETERKRRLPRDDTQDSSRRRRRSDSSRPDTPSYRSRRPRYEEPERYHRRPSRDHPPSDDVDDRKRRFLSPQAPSYLMVPGKEVEDARREDLTVLVVNLSLKATEKDIWQFFTRNAGKVRDIQLIKDARSQKSKGIGYVEFHDAESVLKSLNLTGQCILNQPIRVQASQGEKNRAAKAAKQQQAELAAQGPTKLYVGGLTDFLAHLKADELRSLFSPFGAISQVDLPRDPYTGRNRGFAYLQFRHANEARDAMFSMHGFKLGGKELRVGFATEDPLRTTSTASTAAAHQASLDLDDGEDRLVQISRAALSQKLQEKNPIPLMDKITRCLSLQPMFTPEEVETGGPDFLSDIKEDVRQACEHHGRVVQVWLNDETLDGVVFVKFETEDAARSARNALHGRRFGGSTVVVSFVDDR